MHETKVAKLNAREREVLHLLLRGYDAKSTAQLLDITSNIVNERLRSARRKLGVTSSKEAARLLQEFDESAPKQFVPKNIGIVPPPTLHAFSSLPDQQAAQPAANVVREKAASFNVLPANFSPAFKAPYRGQGEARNNLSKIDRIKVISDLTVRLAAAFVFICLAVILINTLVDRL